MKIAVITGATSGIGLALTTLLLDKGYKVYAWSLTENGWDHTRETSNHHSNLVLQLCNVSDEQAVQQNIEQVIEAEGTIDLFINSAGYIDSGYKLEDISTEEFKKNIDINLYGVYYTCKYAIPHMKSEGKQIVNISSNAGKRAVPSIAAYSAAKFGVVALSQSIAKENEENGLKCFTVCPGGTNTRMREKIFGDAAKQQSADFVAEEIWKAINGDSHIDSGGDMIIRYQKVEINAVPGK